MLGKSEALQVLKQVLKETKRPDTDFVMELSAQRFFWIVFPKSYDDYGTGLGHWVVHRETKQVEAHNPHIDPNVWEEIYLDTLDPTQGWIIRFDAGHKKGIINLKNLLEVPLDEAKSLSESPHWFGGHRVQLASVRELLLEKGIATRVEKVSYSLEIRKIKAFPHRVVFIEDVIRMIRHEDSHWWEDADWRP